jgi:hypothetical protein
MEPKKIDQIVVAITNYLAAGIGNVANGGRQWNGPNRDQLVRYVDGEIQSILTGAWRNYMDTEEETERILTEAQEEYCRGKEPDAFVEYRAWNSDEPPKIFGHVYLFDGPWVHLDPSLEEQDKKIGMAVRAFVSRLATERPQNITDLRLFSLKEANEVRLRVRASSDPMPF